MYQHLVRNADGEPMYVENIRDPYEEEEAYCEEMDLCASDPYYAQMRENEIWYNRACQIFEDQGLDVPRSVITTLSEKLRKKQMEIIETEALREAQPAVDFLNKYFPNMFYARYEYPTPEENGYVYIDFCDWENRPYRDEVEPLLSLAAEQNICIEDFLSLRDLKKRD